LAVHSIRVFPSQHLLQERDLIHREGLNQGSLKHFAEELLLLGGEFLALRGKVEHIDGLVAFRVDQCDFDVAPQARQRRTDLVE